MNNLLLQAIGFVFLLVSGYAFGRLAEKRHVRQLLEREAQMQYLPVVASRFPPEDRPYRQQLVNGSVVVASDYFKTFMASLINMFGGRVTPFESMLDRARREAVLRMKDEAKLMDAAFVFNVKFNTTRVTGSMEVLAYGTAMIPQAQLPAVERPADEQASRGDVGDDTDNG